MQPTATAKKTRWAAPPRSARFLTQYDIHIVDNVRSAIQDAGGSEIAEDMADVVAEAILKAKEDVTL